MLNYVIFYLWNTGLETAVETHTPTPPPPHPRFHLEDFRQAYTRVHLYGRNMLNYMKTSKNNFSYYSRDY